MKWSSCLIVFGVDIDPYLLQQSIQGFEEYYNNTKHDVDFGYEHIEFNKTFNKVIGVKTH